MKTITPTPETPSENDLSLLKRLAGIIKEEADRLIRADKKLTRKVAYQEAQVTVIMRLAEESALSQTESLVLDALNKIQSGQRGREVLRSQIRDRINKWREEAHAKKKPFPEMSEMTINRMLNSLEDKGFVYRPRGPRTKGWSAVIVKKAAA